ncbi:MAG: acyl-CoA/acyl-ACP dehydrogenase [Syntrophaceae bacterium]|nr:acyl-CoA/acyl-ACP dehydrogenase [Syntrophaceae bacterium]
MNYFPWWTDAQKKLADDAKEYVDKVLIPIGERAAWKKEFPWEGIKLMAKKGWFGALVPAQYGGHLEEWGVTGATILLEEVARADSMIISLACSLYGGVHQILHDGTAEQKQRWLPKIASGEEMGSIVMTEPYTGSDAAAIEATAVRDGDCYIINGKKRFQNGSAAASRYMAYFRTSNKPEDRTKYRHLTAFVIEKGAPGFTVERVNEMMAMDGMYNCYLNFDNVRVPVANRLGEEADGWRILTSGLNVERVLNAAPPLGLMRESLRYAMQHLQRRIQFGATTGDIVSNQMKVADMIWKLQIGRLATYYAAYLADMGKEIPVEAAAAKLFTSDRGFESAVDAIQLMGGNGATRFYPAERIMRSQKVRQIAAGTSEILKILLYRMGTKALEPDIKAPSRVMDKELNVPIASGEPLPKNPVSHEDGVLAALAENYRVNPGLYMTLGDLKEQLDISDEDLNTYLLSLEKQGFAGLHRDKRGIALARPTYAGLAKAHPPEYYRYIPEWAFPEDIF